MPKGIALALKPTREQSGRLALAVDEALPPEELHITLAYLGLPEEVAFTQSDLVQAVRDFISTLPDDSSSLSGRINGQGIFTNDQSVLVHLIDIPALPAFRQALVEFLTERGMASKSEHGFIPHMTLAYFDDSSSAKNAMVSLGDVPEEEFSFESIYVMFGGEHRRLPLLRSKKGEGPMTGIVGIFKSLKGRLSFRLSDKKRDIDEVALGDGHAEPERPEEKSMTKTRGIAFQQIMERCWSMLEEFDRATGYYSWPVDIYIEDNGAMYLIVATNGRLYRVRLMVDGANLSFGSFEPVEQLFVPSGEQRTIVHRMPDGRPLIVQIVSTSVLNRVGQIDSRELFDSFVEHANTYDVWPQIDFMHRNELVFGQVISGGLLRIGDCYVAAWRFNDDELSRVAEAGYLESEEQWGASIEFYPLEVDIERIGGVQIPVYRKGINTFITICPETDAAAWYTAEKLVQNRSVGNMNEKEKATLIQLFGGDESAAEKALSAINMTNRQIAQSGQITRIQGMGLVALFRDRLEEDSEATPDQVLADLLAEIVVDETEVDDEDDEGADDGADADEETIVEADVEIEFDLGDEENLEAIAQTIVATDALQEVIREAVNPPDWSALKQAIDELSQKFETAISDATERLAKLEEDEETKRTSYLEELPRGTVTITAPRHRPRIVRDNGDDGDGDEQEQDLAAVAAETLSKWQANGSRN